MLCFSFKWSTRVAAAALALASTPLACLGGQSGAAAPSYAACMARAASTRDMQQCQQLAVTAAGKRLQTALATALHALPADQRAKLNVAQRRWTVFRQSDCEVYYGNDTGTIATIRGGQCLLDRTEERIKQLRDFARPEGN